MKLETLKYAAMALRAKVEIYEAGGDALRAYKAALHDVSNKIALKTEVNPDV